MISRLNEILTPVGLQLHHCRWSESKSKEKQSHQQGIAHKHQHMDGGEEQLVFGPRIGSESRQ